MLPIGTLHKRQTAGMTPDEAPDTFLRCKSAGPCLRVSIKINTQNKTLLEKQIAYFRKHSTTPRWYITMNPQPLNEIFIFFCWANCAHRREWSELFIPCWLRWHSTISNIRAYKVVVISSSGESYHVDSTSLNFIRVFLSTYPVI